MRRENSIQNARSSIAAARLTSPYGSRITNTRRDRTRLHDGRGGPVGHKPGFVYSTDASLNDAKPSPIEENMVAAASTSAPPGP